jgi:hypothetical protein
MLRMDLARSSVVHVLLELTPVREPVRRTRSRQITENDGPGRGEPGVLPAPERAGRCQREKMRQVRSKGVDDRHRLAPVAQPHVHMDAEGLDSPGEPLHLLDDFRIALYGRHPRIMPVAHGMRPGASQNDTVIFSTAPEFGDILLQVDPGLGNCAANTGNDLDGRLHEFMADMPVLTAGVQAGQPGQHLVGVLPQQPGLGVDELHFPFDAESGALGGIPADSHDCPLSAHTVPGNARN